MIKHRFFLTWLVASTLLFAGHASFAQINDAQAVEVSKYGSYIVLMVGDPVIAASKAAGNARLNTSSARVQALSASLMAGQTTAINAVGIQGSEVIHRYTYALNGFSGKMTHQQAQALQARKDVARVFPDRLYQKETDNSPGFLGSNSPASPWSASYDGEGVVIGVVDSGIWPEHASFADDGSYGASPIGEIPCEFGNTDHREDDVAFDCNNKLLGARQMLETYRSVIGATDEEFDSARDDDGHGTHTASTAGGNAGVAASILGGDFGLVAGIAPRARIVAYKGLGIQGGFGSDLAAAIDQAVADGVDVINYSVGSSSFAIGPDDVAFLFAADAGVHVATSNGNAGPLPATTGSPASVPWVTSVGASTQDRTYQGAAVSSAGWEFFGASITPGTAELPLVNAADAGDELCNPGALDPEVVAGKIVLCMRGAIARVDKSEAVFIAGGAGMILYNQNDGQSEVTDTHWLPSVHINNTDGLVIKDYIADNGAAAVAQIDGGVFTTIDSPWMAGFSSRGPNRLSPDLIKPDITAPGVNILAGDTPVNRGELFQMISGTSMSSPHIAGLMALVHQAHPDWSPAMVKSALMTTSYREGVMKEDGATPADPFDMGAGHVNPDQSYAKTDMFNPGLVYDAGLFEYAGYTCGAELGIFSAGNCAFLVSIGIPTDASDLNVPSIGIAKLQGIQVVTRTVTSVIADSSIRRFTPIIKAPPGYKVKVRPGRLKLRGGESASYKVTIINRGAGEEWAFGSITWVETNKAHSIYTPIAVSGARFAAPEQFTGEGEDGSGSLPVSFGYSGSYTAAAHGLEPAEVTQDNVVQDPDQAFDPDDGFSNKHDFVLSGSGLFRIVLPPESVASADIDLDIFIFDPSGVQVASSTNGGTDELVDIVDPVDGTWSVYVHGWQTAGPSADYDLYTWDISTTPGGNLTIDDAPASATPGAIGTVDISWTGAITGQWHLGAVSHSDADGVMETTLVEVDNR